MSFQLSEYPLQSRRLIDAGRRLLEALDDVDLNRGIAITDLEVAAGRPAGEARLRFAPGAGTAADGATVVTLEDDLSTALIELQSANVLISAGIALNEHGAGADRALLTTTLGGVATARAEVETALAASATRRFEALTEPSPTEGAAALRFQESAGKALTAIESGTVAVVHSAFEQLQRIEGAKVLEAIHGMGGAVRVAEVTGRLIRRGVEKLKVVLDALSALFGADAVASVKAKVQDIWKKFTEGSFTEAAVRWVLDVERIEARVKEIAARQGLTIGMLDGVSRSLAALDDDYQRVLKVLKGIAAAIVVAMGILGFLHMVGPWVALAGAVAYVGVLGAALLAGITYAGAGPAIGSTRGVAIVIESAYS